MSEFDLLIFDFDGVVADSEVLANQTLADFLTRLGRPTTLDDAMREFMGRRWSDVKPRIVDWMGRQLPDTFDDDHRAYARPIIRSQVRAVEGVTSFLDKLGKTPRCIASSSSHDWLNFCVDRFAFRPHFGTNIFSATDVANGKPAPDVFLHAAANMGIAPARAVVLEDSPAGIAGARAAGMTAIGFLGASHVRDGHDRRLMDAGAHAVARDYGDVERLLDSGAAFSR